MMMINVTTDIENQSVTWKMEAGEPDHEYQGRKCHRVSNGVSGGRFREMLSSLGYELIGAEAVEIGWGKEIVEYWTRRETTGG